MATVQKKTVLTTGCSAGGIGFHMAKNFQSRGYYVFATARDPSNAADLRDLQDVEVLELDVTIPQTISRCKEIVMKRTGGTLDILVNNAGVEFLDPLLDTDIEEAKKLYEVNVWGPLAMVQAFAPLLIQAKGVVVNQSSIDAAISPVWAGIYASSKAAIARLSETMRLEMAPLGVRVITSMCGSTDTPMFHKPGGRMSLPETSYYSGMEEMAHKERMDHLKQASQVEVLVEALVKDIVGGAKGQIWHGSFAFLIRVMTWALPSWFLDDLVNGPRGIKLVKRP